MTATSGKGATPCVWGRFCHREGASVVHLLPIVALILDNHSATSFTPANFVLLLLYECRVLLYTVYGNRRLFYECSRGTGKRFKRIWGSFLKGADAFSHWYFHTRI